MRHAGEQLATAPLWMLSLVTLLVVLPHFRELDITISLAFLLTILLRVGTLLRQRLHLGRWLLLGLTLLGAALILTRYPLLIGLQAKVALLSLMMGLKLMECRQRRDLYLVVYLGYFTLITHFLFSQEMLTVLYVLLMVTSLTALLVINNRAEVTRGSAVAALRTAGALLLQSLPIMLLLFFLFPRLDDPLWNLGVGNSTGNTGLSDSMSPGSISQLIRSRAVAFRVEFEQVVPPPRQRYWRGPVLWHSDGMRWTRVRLLPREPVSYRSSSPAIAYQITLEPSPNDWLFALDLPQQLPTDATLLADFQLLGKEIRNRRHRYSATSRLDYHTGPLSERQRRLGLQLPENITPRMGNLVAQWQQQGSSPRDTVNQALQFFRNQAFYYTLNPPLLELNPVDQFLFESRRGFCEHYAASFTLLMRLAGIPARVVTGYQGGQINPLGDYLIVRQSDAHAWSEVWLEESGWTRVDPTAAVAPQRIERPFEFDLPEQDTAGLPIDFSPAQRDLLQRLWRQLDLGVDALNTGWHRWILGYSRDQQQRLMQWLGFATLSTFKLALGMVLATAALVALLILLVQWRDRVRPDPVQGAYRKFCRRLARRGMVRLPHEGPKDFARRVIRQRPDLQRPVSAITALYIALRYGSSEDPQQQRRLHQLVRSFRA